jgi:hypothetical protein
MKNVNLMDSEAWTSIIKDRPAMPVDMESDDLVGMQNYMADMFEWSFSISLASQGLTADKMMSDKIAQNLAR